MLQRILTAAIAIPLVLLMMYLNNTIVTTCCMIFLAVMATSEVLVATKYFTNKGIAATCIIFSFVTPSFISFEFLYKYFPVVCFAFLMVLFGIMLSDHERVSFAEVTLVAFVSFLIPVALSTITLTQRNFEHGTFYLVFIFIVAWICDAGAYFVGSAFGKHKMAPKISPKKTWEGFFGGIITSFVFTIILCFGYPSICDIFGWTAITVNIPYMLAISLAGSFLSVMGDFSASLLKRQCEVKDFGSIFPGHGGVLDRFDSVLFVAPFIYIVLTFFEPVSVII